MSKVMGLDIGRASIGVALSDSLRIISSPIETVKYSQDDKGEFLKVFMELINKYKPGEIVVGLPLNMDGSESTTTAYIKEVVALAQSKINLPFSWIDERWTSKSATKMIAQGNFKKSVRKSKNDQVAAAIILQTFLESQN